MSASGCWAILEALLANLRHKAMRPIVHALLLPLLLACPFGMALAQATAKAASPDGSLDPMMVQAGFLSGHPDLRFRIRGLDEFKAGNREDAFRYFQRAAYYADKPSQGMVAEMYWNGQGVPADRALAYAWMDLAAERGYLTFATARERYWSEMTEAERNRALEEGQALYARFGDAAAQPRLATVLRRERGKMTGSRLGSGSGSLQVLVAGPDGEYEAIDGSKFYDPKYWDPKQYQAWHDSVWMRPRIGRVDVGGVEKVPEQGAMSTRVPKVAPDVDAEEPSVPEGEGTPPGRQPPR